METKNQESSIEMKVITTLDAILNIMANALKDSFDPADPESMKLLREFRATLNSRRSWSKFYGLNNENEGKTINMAEKITGQPASAGQYKTSNYE